MNRQALDNSIPEHRLDPVPASEIDNAEEFRCHCGSLLAKITAKGIEIKCRRCKRIRIIALFTSLDAR